MRILVIGGSGPTFLKDDDGMGTAEILNVVLTKAGCDVELAREPHEGLRVYRERGPYDLVFLTHYEGALEFADRVHHKNAEQQLAITTGAPASKVQALQSRFALVLPKPCHLEELVKQIQLLGHR
jgi:DNA-binding response OmpR family regulator